MPINITSRNIVLTGMRGSGKTTIAKVLSRKMDRECLELDEMLVEKMGMKIPEIIEKYGWRYFRDKESEIVQKTACEQNKIISTGGGVILRPANMAALKENGVIVYLNCSVDVLLQRVGEDPNRPALTDKGTRKEETEELLAEREALYKKYADIIIDGDEPDTEEKVVQVLVKIVQDNL